MKLEYLNLQSWLLTVLSMLVKNSAFLLPERIVR